MTVILSAKEAGRVGGGEVSFSATVFGEETSDDVDTRDSESCEIGSVFASAPSSVSEAVDESSIATSTFRFENLSFLFPRFLRFFAGDLSTGPNGKVDISAFGLPSTFSIQSPFHCSSDFARLGLEMFPRTMFASLISYVRGAPPSIRASSASCCSSMERCAART